jgi:hypothetical protein
MITKIFTVRDAIEQNRAAKEARTHALQVRELTKKVKHWEKQVAKFQGEIHARTLAKFQALLAAEVA